jgi:alpha-mannosidase
VLDFGGLTPGFMKTSPVGWFASHRHATDGTNDAYAYAYLFVYALDVPAGTSAMTLPTSERVRILAVSAANDGQPAKPANPLFDLLQR